MSPEFALIARYFERPTPGALLGVGDDAALILPAAPSELALSTDMLVEGTHFLPGTDAADLGHKALAVNLSDLAAMGARARFALLALAMPQVSDTWLAGFSGAFLALAAKHGVELIGGDTTRGPLNICVSVVGEVPPGAALRRSGARAGDEVWVSGTLGDAALGLAVARDGLVLEPAYKQHCLARLNRPQPRLELGLALRGLASSAIDVSDGLVADLGHIAERSGLGACLRWESLPLSAALQALPDQGLRQRLALAGGDDYELCFTATPRAAGPIEALGLRLGLRLTRVGSMVEGQGVGVESAGQPLVVLQGGYDHFA